MQFSWSQCPRIEPRSYLIMHWAWSGLLFQRTILFLLGRAFLLFHMWYIVTQRYFPTQRNSTLTTSCLEEFRVDIHLLTFHSVLDPGTVLVRHDLMWNSLQVQKPFHVRGHMGKVSFDKTTGITKMILNGICQAWSWGWMGIGLGFCQKQKLTTVLSSQLFLMRKC
jgi:hypothetical protein